MENIQSITKELGKIKKHIDTFNKKFGEKLSNEYGFYFLLAVIKDRGTFVDQLKYGLNELSINTTNIEKHLIFKKLAEKYKKKDKEDLKEQKKLIKKQLKEIKDGRANAKANRVSKTV